MIVTTSRLITTILFEFDTPLLSKLRFRLELYQREETFEYYPRLYRIESLRVQPTFPQIEGDPDTRNLADYDVYVGDEFLQVSTLTGKNSEEVVNKVRDILFKAFQEGN